jgi:hypothetical protein
MIVVDSKILEVSLCYQGYYYNKGCCMCFPVSLSSQQSNVFDWQMQEYHAHFHNQPQFLNIAALQHKEKTWHDLANQYGLNDMMNVSPTQLAC